MSTLQANQIDIYSDVFTKLENEIRISFEAISSSISQRRDHLLAEISELKSEFEKKMGKRLKNIRDLEDMKERLDLLDVENDEASHRLKTQLLTITEALEEQRKRILIPNYVIKCDNKPLIKTIESLGKISIEDSGEEKIYYEVMEQGMLPDKPVKIREEKPTLPPKPQHHQMFRPIKKDSLEELPQGHSYEILTKRKPQDTPLPPRPVTPDPLPYETPFSTFDTFVHQTSSETFNENTLLPSGHSETLIEPNPQKSVASAKSSFEGRKKPLLSFCRRGSEKGQMMQPRGVHCASLSQNIYVVSRDQHKILVFTLKGKFIVEFGKEHLEGPSSVTVHFGKCYVTDEKANGIFIFRTGDYEIEGSHIFKRGSQPGKIKSLKSIAIDTNNEIFLVDTSNDQVCILNFDLTMNRTLGFGILQKPQDVSVSMQKIVYVLDLQAASCVHTFTSEGEHLNSIINTDTLGQDTSSIPNYFCVSQEGLIILSILYESTLKVYTSDGEMVQEIGKKQSAKDRLSNSQGICLTNDNRIVCAFAEGSFCINIY